MHPNQVNHAVEILAKAVDRFGKAYLKGKESDAVRERASKMSSYPDARDSMYKQSAEIVQKAEKDIYRDK